MDSQKRKKLVKYIRKCYFKKLKSYVKKHHLQKKINSACFEKDQTLLHVACSEGQDDIAWYLIKKGADVHIQDQSGNLPVHLALQCALAGNKSAYTDIVEPMCARYADCLDVKNRKGLTPRETIKDFGHLLGRKTSNGGATFSEPQSRGGERKASGERDEFKEKMWRAMAEDEGEGGRYDPNDGYNDGGLEPETFTDWGDRIAAERRKRAAGDWGNAAADAKRRREREQAKRQEEARAFTKKLEEDAEKRRRKLAAKAQEDKAEKDAEKLLKQTQRYLKRREAFLLLLDDASVTRLDASQLPWPTRDAGDAGRAALVAATAEDARDVRQGARRAQRLWHPDKLWSRVRDKLEEGEREETEKRITAVCQAINGLMEKT